MHQIKDIYQFPTLDGTHYNRLI